MLYKSDSEWYMNKPLCKNLNIYIGIQLESLVYVSAAEVEISDSEYEKKPILRKWPLKICIVKIHIFLVETTIYRHNILSNH